MCEGHISCPKFIKLAQSSQAGVDSMSTLHSNKRSDLLTAIGSIDVGYTCGKLEVGGILTDHLLDDVNLIQKCSSGVLVLGVT